jgi:hypothetical protein
MRLDPVIKLAIVVALGITITMLMGVGQPSARDKLAVINNSQLNAGHAPRAINTRNVLSLDNYRVNLD